MWPCVDCELGSYLSIMYPDIDRGQETRNVDDKSCHSSSRMNLNSSRTSALWILYLSLSSHRVLGSSGSHNIQECPSMTGLGDDYTRSGAVGVLPPTAICA